jgi:hypothetical protein
LLAGEAAILTANAGAHTALGWVEVAPADDDAEPPPPEQVEFEKGRYQVRWHKKKRLTVQAPLDPALDGAEVHVSSDAPGIAIIGGVGRLHIDIERGALVGHVMIEGRSLHAKAKITAKVNDTCAECRASVSSQDEGAPDLEIRLQDQSLGSFRSTLKEEEVAGRRKLYLDVMTKHPTLNRYIGAPPDYRGQDTIPWRVLLAEVIAEAIVRRVLERKYPVESQGTDAEGFFVELFQRTADLAPRIHRELVSDSELSTESPLPVSRLSRNAVVTPAASAWRPGKGVSVQAGHSTIRAQKTHTTNGTGSRGAIQVLAKDLVELGRAPPRPRCSVSTGLNAYPVNL